VCHEPQHCKLALQKPIASWVKVTVELRGGSEMSPDHLFAVYCRTYHSSVFSTATTHSAEYIPIIHSSSHTTRASYVPSPTKLSRRTPAETPNLPV
jgi:hypothetical protein